uniref:Uncharacterized protein n=1 Tax=Hyaloperonospora arabidopsidis (strain Emoy2) TaxID=559515 RepID=M4C558_HYAAE
MELGEPRSSCPVPGCSRTLPTVARHVFWACSCGDRLEVSARRTPTYGRLGWNFQKFHSGPGMPTNDLLLKVMRLWTRRMRYFQRLGNSGILPYLRRFMPYGQSCSTGWKTRSC